MTLLAEIATVIGVIIALLAFFGFSQWRAFIGSDVPSNTATSTARAEVSTIQAAIPASETQKSPTPRGNLDSPGQVQDLTALRDLARQRELIEHISDSETVRLTNYPTAVKITITRIIDTGTDSSIITLGGGDEATLDFAEGIYAIGFMYQEGLEYGLFTVKLVDGSMLDFKGQGFFPDTNFFGFTHQNPSVPSLYAR